MDGFVPVVDIEMEGDVVTDGLLEPAEYGLADEIDDAIESALDGVVNDDRKEAGEMLSESRGLFGEFLDLLGSDFLTER